MKISHTQALDICRLSYQYQQPIEVGNDNGLFITIDNIVMKWNPFEGQFCVEEK